MTNFPILPKISWLIQTRGSLFLLVILVLNTGCVDTEQTVEGRLFGEQLTLIWSKHFDGPINLPPITSGDTVIVAPAGEPLVALDPATGEQRWQFAPSLRIWERAITANDDFVYIGLEGGRLLALDIEDGEIQWGRDLEINVQHAPLVVNYALFVPTTFVGPGLESNSQGRAKLFALNSFDGEILWEYQTDNYILQTPYFVQESIYVAGSYQDPSIEVEEGGPMRLYALSATTGSPLWTFESKDGFAKALYAYKDAVAYVSNQDFISAMDTQSGNLLWRKNTGNWVPSLTGERNTIYFGSANTVVHAWNILDGSNLWEYNIPGGSFNYMLGAPVKVADDLYFLTQRGDIIALDARDGTELWKIATGIQSGTGLSVANGWLFIGDSEGVVYAYTNR